MELTKLDRRSFAEAAQFLHLKDPETGKPLMDGDQAIGAMVKGSHARSVQAELSAIAKADTTSIAETLRQTLEESQAYTVKAAAAATESLVGVTKDGKPLAKADFPAFFDATFLDVDHKAVASGERAGSFAQQVMRFSDDLRKSFTLA